jgi:plasmid stabilization system protein ParE
MYEVVATPVFKLCLDRLICFLETKYSPRKAQATKSKIKKYLATNLSENQHIAPISNRLIELGIKNFRQYPVDEHNMVFYRINEDKKQLVLLAVMDSRQNIQKLLLEVMLLN